MVFIKTAYGEKTLAVGKLKTFVYFAMKKNSSNLVLALMSGNFRTGFGVAVGLFLVAAVVVHVTRGPSPEFGSGAARSIGHDSLSEPKVLRRSVSLTHLCLLVFHFVTTTP